MARGFFISFSEEASDTNFIKQFSNEIERLIAWDSGELVEPENKILENAFDELNQARDRSKLNPEIEPASERAYREARKWIVWATNNFGLTNPFIVVPGNGDIRVEWNDGDDFISVKFDEEYEDMDTIFYQLDNKIDSEDFNEERLEELITTLIYKEEFPPIYSVHQAQTRATTASANISRGFTHTGFVAHAS